jgi:hypothetical protein
LYHYHLSPLQSKGSFLAVVYGHHHHHHKDLHRSCHRDTAASNTTSVLLTTTVRHASFRTNTAPLSMQYSRKRRENDAKQGNIIFDVESCQW